MDTHTSLKSNRGGILLFNAAHSWIRRCRFSNVNDGFNMNFCYASSALENIVDGQRGHHIASFSVATYCLVGLLSDYTDEGMWHGVTMSNRSAGTVVWRVGGDTLKGPDAHGSQPRYTLVR